MKGQRRGYLSSRVACRFRAPVYLYGRDLTPHALNIDALHLWSEENVWADALSRVSEGHRVPEELVSVTRSEVPTVRWRILGRTPTPPHGARAKKAC